MLNPNTETLLSSEDESFESETPHALAERFKREKEYAECHKMPMPKRLPNEMEKINRIIGPDSDFFEHYKPGKQLG